MTTPPNREALRALCEKATPDIRLSLNENDLHPSEQLYRAARTAIPALLDELERVEAERKTMQAVVDNLHRACAVSNGNEMSLAAQRDAALAEAERLKAWETIAQMGADRIESIERDTAERIAAWLEAEAAQVKDYREWHHRAATWPERIRAGHYRPTSHAPREGGGDE